MIRRTPNEENIVSLVDIKEELRIDDAAEDRQLKRIVRAAQLAAENWLGVDLLPATYSGVVDNTVVVVVKDSLFLDTDSVPEDIRQAILLIAVNVYENRDQPAAGIPLTAEMLLAPYKEY